MAVSLGANITTFFATSGDTDDSVDGSFATNVPAGLAVGDIILTFIVHTITNGVVVNGGLDNYKNMRLGGLATDVYHSGVYYRVYAYHYTGGTAPGLLWWTASGKPFVSMASVIVKGAAGCDIIRSNDTTNGTSYTTNTFNVGTNEDYFLAAFIDSGSDNTVNAGPAGMTSRFTQDISTQSCIAIYDQTTAVSTFPSKTFSWNSSTGAFGGAAYVLGFKPKPVTSGPYVSSTTSWMNPGNDDDMLLQKPATATQGSVLVAEIYHPAGAVTVTSAPSGWTKRLELSSMPSKYFVYTKFLETNDSVYTYNWKFSAASTIRGSITSVSNVGAIDSFDSATQAAATSITVDVGAVANNDSLIVAMFYNDVDPSITSPPAGMDLMIEDMYNIVNSQAVALYEQAVNAQAATTKSLTWGGTNEELAAFTLVMRSQVPDTPSITAPATSSRFDFTDGTNDPLTITGSAFVGVEQEGWALKRRVSGGGTYTWWKTATSTWESTEVYNAGTANGYTFDTNNFDATAVNGDTWLVSMSYSDTNGTSSDYSSEITIIHNDLPSVAITVPADLATLSSSELLAEWVFTAGGTEAQDSYRVVVDQTTGGTTTVHDSGVVASSYDEYSVPYVFEDSTDYTIQVTVVNAYGKSATDTHSFDVSFTPPPTPTLQVVKDDATTQVTLTASAVDTAPYNGAIDFIFEYRTHTLRNLFDLATAHCQTIGMYNDIAGATAAVDTSGDMKAYWPHGPNVIKCTHGNNTNFALVDIGDAVGGDYIAAPPSTEVWAGFVVGALNSDWKMRIQMFQYDSGDVATGSALTGSYIDVDADTPTLVYASVTTESDCDHVKLRIQAAHRSDDSALANGEVIYVLAASLVAGTAVLDPKDDMPGDLGSADTWDGEWVQIGAPVPAVADGAGGWEAIITTSVPPLNKVVSYRAKTRADV